MFVVAKQQKTNFSCKPNFASSKFVPFLPDFFPSLQNPPVSCDTLQTPQDDINILLPEDYSESHRCLHPSFWEVTHTYPTPSIETHTLAPGNSCTRSCNSYSSSSLPLSAEEFSPLAMCTCSRSCSQSPSLLVAEKPKRFLPQVVFQPLTVLREGEGLEDIENAAHDKVTINIVNGQNSWTLVQRKKNRKKKDNLSRKWNKQQRLNFECFGDKEPFENYHAADTTPPAVNLPLQQHVQQPVAGQPPPPQPTLLPLPQSAPQALPLPLIAVTPPPGPRVLEKQK
jgi:hypothetical protein